MTHAIQADGLEKRFGETRALAGVSLTAPPGTVLGVLGPNGAGKTTMTRILATLIEPTAGSARVGGYDVVKDAHKVRQLIGLTGQYAGGRRDAHRHREPRPDRAAARACRAAPPRRARPSCSSGSSSPTPPNAPPRPTPAACAAGSTSRPAWSGVRRSSSWTSRPPASTRAAATACGTSCASLVDDGVTVLLTTQYLEEADQLADDIVVIDRGQIIAHGTSDVLKAQVGGQVLEVRPVDPTDRRHRREDRRRPDRHRARTSTTTCVSTPITDPGVMPAVVRRLDDAGVDVGELSLRKASLDEVFFALTGHHTDDIDAEADELAQAADKEGASA